MIWLLLTLVLVLAAKYYTATRVRHMETRLNEAKEGIGEARNRLKQVKDRQDKAKEQEKLFRFRLERLQALVQDMEIDLRMPRRSQTKEEEEDYASVPSEKALA